MPQVESLLSLVWGSTRDHRCHYCRAKLMRGHGGPHQEATVDHKTPRCLGGPDHLDNLVLACKSCNCRKARKTYDDFMAQLAAERDNPAMAYVVTALGSSSPGILLTGRGVSLTNAMWVWLDSIGHKVVPAPGVVPDGCVSVAPRAISGDQIIAFGVRIVA